MNRSTVMIAGSCAALVSLVVSPSQASRSGTPGTTSWISTCVAEARAGAERAAVGQTHLQPLRGLTIVGSRGIRAKLVGAGSGVGSLTVVAADDSKPAALARRYAASGRSVVLDAAAAGVSTGFLRHLCAQARNPGTGRAVAAGAGDGTIFDSICTHDEVDYVEWDACVTRYRVSDTDVTYNYGIDDAQAWGHETESGFWNDLHSGGVKNSYATTRVDITKASPSSDIPDVDHCYNQSLGVTIAGFGVSSGGTVCPDRWNVTRLGTTAVPEYHKVQWEGETNDDVEAIAVSGYRVAQGYSSSYSITINWDVH
jgi:hypothetical protein